LPITKQQLEELKEGFSLFDKNGDGFLTVSELTAVLEAIGVLKENATQEKLKKVDKEKGINFEDYVTFMEPYFVDYGTKQ
jgi:Ca2+-binding EF-hand superfamily protein